MTNTQKISFLRGHTSAGIRRRLEEADKKSAYDADKENGK